MKGVSFKFHNAFSILHTARQKDVFGVMKPKFKIVKVSANPQCRPASTYSKSTIKTLKQGVKYVHS